MIFILNISLFWLVIIDALNSGTINDALLVPVSVNYERLCDGNFVYEQLGEKKKPEKFTSAVAAIWGILNSKYGQMRIDFNEPFSLRELIKAFEKSSPDVGEPTTMPKILKHSNSSRRLKHQPSTSSLYGTDVVDEEHRALVDSIARHVVYDCATATACMTTNAVAFLLLTRFVKVKVLLIIFSCCLRTQAISLAFNRCVIVIGVFFVNSCIDPRLSLILLLSFFSYFFLFFLVCIYLTLGRVYIDFEMVTQSMF